MTISRAEYKRLQEQAQVITSLTLQNEWLLEQLMLKALPWFGQMDGYNLTITAVDLQRDAADRFAFQCPELC